MSVSTYTFIQQSIIIGTTALEFEGNIGSSHETNIKTKEMRQMDKRSKIKKEI